jgi:phosphate acetyltransferase
LSFGKIATNGRDWEEIRVGECVEQKRVAAFRDVLAYLGAADDYNPLYLTENYAEQTEFGRLIVPPSLIVGWLTALISTRLPGPGSVIKEMNFAFSGVLHPEEEIDLKLEVIRKKEQERKVTLKAIALRGENVILTGECDVTPPKPLKPSYNLFDNF